MHPSVLHNHKNGDLTIAFGFKIPSQVQVHLLHRPQFFAIIISDMNRILL